MALLELHFSSGEASLSVRRFSVREALSGLFDVSVWALSPDEALDLGAIVGRPAALLIASGVAHAARGDRIWSGVCSAMEQVQAEQGGLSTYHLRIVPSLWLLTQRRNHRVFQHASAPDIVRRMLADWGIEATWQIDPAQHPKLEYRVQHGETDEIFIRRILEEAGISFAFADEDGERSSLVFSDAPHAVVARQGGPLRNVDNPNQAGERDFVTGVRLQHEVRPGKIVLWDHDFRGKSDYRMPAEAGSASHDARLEHYRYDAGAFLAEGHRSADTPIADRHGVSRADERSGRRQAEVRLAAEDAQRTRVAFRTNALDLRPGIIFNIQGHVHPELSADHRLLVTELTVQGTHDGEWTAEGHAAFAAHPYHPARTTPKPSIHSVESAIIVGPAGEEIHTDEHGRVRVQFHWDRAGDLGEHSSCWVRVSQGWAGAAYGMLALPRIGQEVLVAFLGGDPDQPVVVGRVFNGTSRVPYKLPEHKTRSTWKSDSSPGSGGFNEIMFEDAKGKELVYMQAERDFEKLVKHDEVFTVGRNRSTTVGEVDASAIGTKHTVNIRGTPTGTEMVAGRISFTTGAATLTIDGPNITLDASSTVTLKAGANIVIQASADVTVNGGATVAINGAANVTVGSGGPATVQAGGGDLVLQGGPMVQINPGAGAAAAERADDTLALMLRGVPMVVPPDADVLADAEAAELLRSRRGGDTHWFAEKLAPGGEWDFKRHGEQYEAFSAFHFGVIGRAAGFPKGVILRQAGKRFRERWDARPEWGDPDNGLWNGEPPYGHPPHLSRMVQLGYDFHAEIERNPGLVARAMESQEEQR